jgi:hypothetical protein
MFFAIRSELAHSGLRSGSAAGSPLDDAHFRVEIVLTVQTLASKIFQPHQLVLPASFLVISKDDIILEITPHFSLFELSIIDQCGCLGVKPAVVLKPTAGFCCQYSTSDY